MRVGFVGLGNIGAACARHFPGSDHDFGVHDIDRAAARSFIDGGARGFDSPAELAAWAELVILSLPGPPEVEAVVGGEQGILEARNEGLIVVDLSTNSLQLAREMYARCAEAGVHYVDSPVSGGIWAAEAAELTLMPSGDRAAVESALPVLKVFAREQTDYLGESGTGTLIKLINNQIFLAGGQIFQEGYLMAAKAGLDIRKFVGVLKESSAAFYIPLASMVTKRQWEDSTYDLALAEKDVRLAVESADALGTPVPIARAAHETLLKAMEMGLGRKFFLATMEALESQAQFTAPAVDVDEAG